MPGAKRMRKEVHSSPSLRKPCAPALVHEGVVARAERVPRPRVVDGQLPGQDVEGLRERLVEVRRRTRAVRRDVVLDQAVPPGRDRAGRDHAQLAGLPVGDQRVVRQGPDVDQRGVHMRHARHPGSRPGPTAPSPHGGPRARLGTMGRRTTGYRTPSVRHPSAVIGRWQPDLDRGAAVPGAIDASRGPEHRVAALTLAALLVVGGADGHDQPLRGRRAARRRPAAGSTPPRWRLLHRCRGAAGGPQAGRPVAHVRAGPAR